MKWPELLIKKMSSNRFMAPNRTLKIIFIGLCLIDIALANQTTNTFNQSFNQAKKKLQNQIYADHRRTFYCDCPYTAKNTIISSDKYTPKKHNKRANRVEWEHIPAYAFGQSFVEWRDGHTDCMDKKGKPFKGRNCARKASLEFRYMDGYI